MGTRGGLADAFGVDIFEKCVVTTNCEKSAEAIVPGKNPGKRPSHTLCKPPRWCIIEAPHWRLYYTQAFGVLQILTECAIIDLLKFMKSYDKYLFRKEKSYVKKSHVE